MTLVHIVELAADRLGESGIAQLVCGNLVDGLPVPHDLSLVAPAVTAQVATPTSPFAELGLPSLAVTVTGFDPRTLTTPYCWFRVTPAVFRRGARRTNWRIAT